MPPTAPVTHSPTPPRVHLQHMYNEVKKKVDVRGDDKYQVSTTTDSDKKKMKKKRGGGEINHHASG